MIIMLTLYDDLLVPTAERALLIIKFEKIQDEGTLPGQCKIL